MQVLETVLSHLKKEKIKEKGRDRGMQKGRKEKKIFHFSQGNFRAGIYVEVPTNSPRHVTRKEKGEGGRTEVFLFSSFSHVPPPTERNLAHAKIDASFHESVLVVLR